MWDQAQHDTESGSLRADLKMKMFEIGRLGMLVEEKTSGNRQLQRETEMLREKLDVLKGEFAKLEVDARLAGVGHKHPQPTAVEIKKSSLEISLEVDEQVRVSPNLVMHPTPIYSPRSQAPHSQPDFFVFQVRVLTMERDKLRDANAKWKSAFADAKLPQRMVLESLRKKQDEVCAANEETEQLRETLLKVTQQNEHLREERAAMEGDMETILKQRAELQQQVTSINFVSHNFSVRNVDQFTTNLNTHR